MFAQDGASINEYIGTYAFTFISDYCPLSNENLVKKRIRPPLAYAESFLISLLLWVS